jgi:hypothetical protein
MPGFTKYCCRQERGLLASDALESEAFCHNRLTRCVIIRNFKTRWPIFEVTFRRLQPSRTEHAASAPPITRSKFPDPVVFSIE